MDPNTQSPTQTPLPPAQPVALQPVTAAPRPISRAKPINWLIILLAVFVVILSLVTSGFFAYQNYQLTHQPISILPTPTPPASPQPTAQASDPTADWKTYINTKVGFQIKYPPNGYSKPRLPSGVVNSPNVYADENTDNNDIIFGDGLPSLEVFEFSGNLDEFINYYKSGKAPVFTPAAAEVVTSTTTLQVDGVSAKKYETRPEIVYPETENLRSIFIYWVGHKHGFVLNGGTQNEKDQILSTFKFVDTGKTTGAGCNYIGGTYKNGESFRVKCNTCSCESGQVVCTLMACQ